MAVCFVPAPGMHARLLLSSGGSMPAQLCAVLLSLILPLPLPLGLPLPPSEGVKRVKLSGKWSSYVDSVKCGEDGTPLEGAPVKRLWTCTPKPQASRQQPEASNAPPPPFPHPALIYRAGVKAAPPHSGQCRSRPAWHAHMRRRSA